MSSEDLGEGHFPLSLECHVAMENDTAWIRLVGEFDLASVPRVEARLQEVATAGAREMVVDLDRVTFMDSSGLRLLVGWVRTAAAAKIAFSIVRAQPQVKRLFSLTGTEELLPFRSTKDGG